MANASNDNDENNNNKLPIDCQVCHELMSDNSNTPFYLTSCAHVLCSKHYDKNTTICPYCNARGITVLNLKENDKSNDDEEINKFFEPLPLQLENLYSISMFQNKILQNRCKYLYDYNKILTDKVSKQRQILIKARDEINNIHVKYKEKIRMLEKKINRNNNNNNVILIEEDNQNYEKNRVQKFNNNNVDPMMKSFIKKVKKNSTLSRASIAKASEGNIDATSNNNYYKIDKHRVISGPRTATSIVAKNIIGETTDMVEDTSEIEIGRGGSITTADTNNNNNNNINRVFNKLGIIPNNHNTGNMEYATRHNNIPNRRRNLTDYSYMHYTHTPSNNNNSIISSRNGLNSNNNNINNLGMLRYMKTNTGTAARQLDTGFSMKYPVNSPSSTPTTSSHLLSSKFKRRR
ncbi:uncharacterized protein SCODWIG_02078 [Saccharomycodes ludwigii]|uniref:RING-type domain-containing protein n=1 Tax=Saccharomycodes ludwigii TaxID=36035 RepID=A0A376B6J1_9ASCO|nr:hypothetical protein SCDLUD_004260 [Saccharomycodes ludwigii]KAH3899944.1 hypothetical protein SCDLUD_004260 [Saccharomycodes ludwigii]SSD60317.1 uncharacterized protein SCODWIG_02078 [Saccharomycodes ludwigii]